MRYGITCPGQGFIKSNLLLPYINHRPIFQNSLDIIDDALNQKFSQKLFNNNDQWLLSTKNAQPAIVATTYIINQILQKLYGINLITPNAVIMGHSLGEYTGLLLNGKLSLSTTIKLVSLRGQLMEQLDLSSKEYTMKVIMFKPSNYDHIVQICSQHKVLANINSHQQVVLSGKQSTITETIKLINSQNRIILKVIDLPVEVPFHNEVMAPVESELKSFLEQEEDIGGGGGITTMISNLTGKVSDDQDLIENTIAVNSKPVRWVDSINTLTEMGVTEVINFGPGQVLHNLNGKFPLTNYSLDTLEDTKLIGHIRGFV